MHGVETPAYTRPPPALPAPRDEPRSSLECPLTQELCPAHMHMTCTYAHAHAPVLLYEETLKPQSPSVLTPRFPDPDRPAHTSPRKHLLLWRSEGCVLELFLLQSRR